MSSLKSQIIKLIPSPIYLRLRWYWQNLFYRQTIKQLQEKRKRVIAPDAYSMKPFDEKKAIFVHIPKCAGVSINKALFGNLAGGHNTLNNYLDIFEPHYIEEYFKFTVVRNPWDRLVSAFFFLKKGGFNDGDKAWAEKELSDYDDFESFVKGWLTPENIWKWHHFRPQYHYFSDTYNKVPIDYIAYLETIDEDFGHIAKHIGVATSLGTSNSTGHNGYKAYYTSETRDIVAQVYKKDIELLGYDFDNERVKSRHL